MARLHDDEIDVDEGLVSSFPITCDGGEWSIVEGVELTDFSKEKIKATVDELRGERDAVKELGLV